MKSIINHRNFAGVILFALMQSCSSLFNLPSNSEKSTMGEVTSYTTELKKLPPPKEKIVIGVYKFRDQTGQYKPSENGSNWSTAVPQGTTTILIKALEDSKWFVPIERENIANLLNERQIIRSTRQEYLKEADKNVQSLPPLLYAGILLEGGVISYDSNVMTGGIGARYFGIGLSSQYRQDRITIYLRAVSTLNGEILKTVYTSKTILSTSVNGNFFRYIDTERLLESEVGVTQNEPVQLAVTEAIEKAVKSLIVEGVRDKIWGSAIQDPTTYKALIEKYETEQEDNDKRIIGNKYPNNYRQKVALFANVEGQQIKGDYVNPKASVGFKLGLKYFLSDHINVELNANVLTLRNQNILARTFLVSEVNLEYLMLPKYKLSPFLYAGGGSMFSENQNFFKAQFGGGLEYLMDKNFAIRLSSQYDLGFTDNWDRLVNGKQKDQAIRVALGINFYLGKK
ncbi:CsgG/HfaB family protein [Chryseobacterium sp. KACC 21268]|nr:CsgG/HfaB family protein [Chryseobacterium sp. KACC 21268]